MKTTLHLFAISFLIWLIPFVSSFPFFGRDGKLAVNFWMFKAVMVLILLVSSYFLFRWFYLSSGLTGLSFINLFWIGSVAAILSILLDQFTVVKMSQLSLTQYFTQIGWLYVLIIGMSLWVGSRS